MKFTWWNKKFFSLSWYFKDLIWVLVTRPDFQVSYSFLLTNGIVLVDMFSHKPCLLFLFRGSQTKKLAESAPMCTAWSSHVVGCFFQRQMTDFVVGWWHLIIFQKIQSIQIRQEQPTTMWGIRRIWMRISPLNSPQHSGSASWPAFSSLAPSFDRRPPQRMLTSVELLLLIPRMKPSLLNLCGAFSSEIYLSCLSGEVTFSLEAYFWLSRAQPRQPDTFNHERWKYNKTGLNFELVPQ